MSIALLIPHRLAILVLTLVIPLCIGCGTIGEKQHTDFLKPFARMSSTALSASTQAMPSEYEICIETARTVAEQGHVVEAIKLYERAEKLDPAAPSLDAALAPLFASVGRYDLAIERYKRCVDQSPQDVALSNNFAWTLMEAGRFDHAIMEANRGLDNHGDDGRLQATLAMIHYRQGDREKALDEFEKAHGLVAAHHNLSVLEIDAGNLESAKNHLRIAKQSAEPNSQSEVLLSTLETQTSRH